MHLSNTTLQAKQPRLSLIIPTLLAQPSPTLLAPRQQILNRYDALGRRAAKTTGGVTTSFLLELLIYPAIYLLWKWHFEVKKQAPGSQ